MSDELKKLQPDHYLKLFIKNMEEFCMEWNADQYYRNANMQYRVGQVAIEQLNPQDGERILEIGCGPGRLTTLIAQKIPNGEVLATDLSQNMIEKAGESMTLSGLTNVQFACINALTMQFGNEFDAIFSNFAVQWVFQPRRLYKKLYKALKPGGRIVITVPAQTADITLNSSE